jgi:heme/copper-type cytochrome/quinol oxidase subunit 2
MITTINPMRYINPFMCSSVFFLQLQTKNCQKEKTFQSCIFVLIIIVVVGIVAVLLGLCACACRNEREGIAGSGQ